MHLAGRAAIIGTGCYFAGFRGADLVKASLSGAVAIEVAVLLYTTTQLRSREAQADTEEAEAVEAKEAVTEGLRNRLVRQRRRVVVARHPGAPLRRLYG